ncbi:hypothetical protein EHB20_24840 [Salmonella enterica subsp. enterica serovar Muenchen]|nr:hypothetical protein [Salmonella enterica subsp. enterica serovar Muenchen]
MIGLTDLRKGDFLVCQKGLFGFQVTKYNGEILDVFDAQKLGKYISKMDNIQRSNMYLSDKLHNKSGYFSVTIYNVLNKFNVFNFCVLEKNIMRTEGICFCLLKRLF